MSLFKETVPIGVIVLCSLGLTLGIHEYSKADTSERLQQLTTLRATEESALAEEKAANTEALNIRVAEATVRNDKEVAAQKAVEKAAVVAALPGDPAKGKNFYMTCMACHGLKGEGMRALNSPRLAGQEAWYLKAQMRKFKEGIRGSNPKNIYGMQMAPMAKILADEAVDDVIAYIATFDTGKPADKGSGDAAAGKMLYPICAACHGPQGQGIEAQKAPEITNQHAWYMERQIKNFKNGIRGAHEKDIEGKLMIPMVQTLTDDKAIANVVAYIQSLNE